MHNKLRLRNHHSRPWSQPGEAELVLEPGLFTLRAASVYVCVGVVVDAYELVMSEVWG